MVDSFTYDVSPARIVFGKGSVGSVADEVRGQNCSRALVLSTPFQKDDAEGLAANLGNLTAGVFGDATMHTPVDITEKALAIFEEQNADCVVALGGGSTIGLGKAIAYRNDCPQIVVPTTYAGSEVTPILGQTEDGLKTTLNSPRVLPEVVIYDPELSVGLPVPMTIASGLNAMAHAVEGAYAKDRNPISSLQAVEGVRALRDALPKIVAEPDNLDARGEALYGSWLCGSVLGAVGMSLHHKLCHTLGGSFDLPHAETHAILLPHSAAYNAHAAEKELGPIADLFGGDVGGGLWDFSNKLGAPLALNDIGFERADIDRAADLAVKTPYWNPRPVERDGVRALLERAVVGERPV